MKVIGVLLAGWLALGVTMFDKMNLHAEPVRVTKNLRGETVILPGSAPETANFLLVSSFEVLAGPILFIVASFDDPKSQIGVDYIEVYLSTGELLAIAWLDEFGIQRSAVDYSFVGEEIARPSGVLVLLQEGIPA